MSNSKEIKTRRQQFGMPDRWRLLEKLDPTVMVIFPEVPEKHKNDEEKCKLIWKRLEFVRRSKLEELKEQYGEDLKVL